jgi:predicted DNA-binding transcriptional regulator AlpA
MMASRGALPARRWTLEETARFLALPVGTLYQLNHKRTGPRFHKIGRHCRYDPREVQAWLDDHVSDADDPVSVGRSWTR